MKIVFNLGGLSKGGAERVVSNLSNYLVELKNEVSIITTVQCDSVYKLHDKINLYSLDKGSTHKNFIIKNIVRIKELIKNIKKIKPDIIVSFLPEPSYRILLLKLLNRKLKVIISIRNDPNIEYESLINRTMMRILYPLADGVVFQTEDAKEFFSKNIQKKSIIIPNPVAEEFFDKSTCNKNQKLIVSVGRLELQKNQKMLINVFSDIIKEKPDYKLIIYGEGALKNELNELIYELKLEKNVFLLGNVNDIKEKLDQASIFVLSSNYEGMPNSLMEALARGVICVSSDCPCGGPKFLIKDGENGFLFRVGDENDLYLKLKYALQLSKEEQLYISENAKKRMKELHPQKINRMWNDYISKVKE